MHRALQGRCGIFCGTCEIYIAYATDNMASRRRIAKAFDNGDSKAIAADQVKCLGCKGSMPSPWRSSCKIRECAEERGMEFCYQCRQYPCEILDKFLDSHPQARENLRTISKIGPDAWLAKMMTRCKNDEEKPES